MTTLLLAGTPCSGLTLLRGLLHGNRQVFISPETALFAHSILWTGAGEQWRCAYMSFLRGESKHALPLSCPLVPSVHEHSLAAIGLDANVLSSLVEASRDGLEFVGGIQQYVEALQGPAVWLDALHANLYGIEAFLAADPNGRALISQRHGLDHISALMAAGHGFKEAARLWFAEAAMAKSIAEKWPERVRIVDYAEIIRDAGREAAQLCDWLGVERHSLTKLVVQDGGRAIKLEDRHLAYIAGLKLAAEFADLIGGAPTPSWKGADLLAWTGATLPEALLAREDLEQAEKDYSTDRGRMLSPFVKFSAVKQPSAAKNSSGGLAGRLRRLLGRETDGGVRREAAPSQRRPASGRLPATVAQAGIVGPCDWNWQSKTVIPLAPGATQMVCVVAIHGGHELARKTIGSLLSAPDGGPALALVLVACGDADWQFAMSCRQEDARICPVAAPAGPAGLAWQIGVSHARSGDPRVVFMLEPGQMAGADYPRLVWRLLAGGNGAAGLLGFDLVAFAAWTTADEEPDSDHFGRTWVSKLRGGVESHASSIARAYARDLLERMEWRLFDETLKDQIHQNSWQRAMACQPHFHLEQDTAAITVSGSSRLGSNAWLSDYPRDFMRGA